LAAAELRATGGLFRQLPDPWHAFLALLQTGRCRAREIRILHLIHFLRSLRRPDRVRREMKQFLRKHGRTLSRPDGPLRGGASFWDRVRRFSEIREDHAIVRRYVEGLYRDWVAPALAIRDSGVSRAEAAMMAARPASGR